MAWDNPIFHFLPSVHSGRRVLSCPVPSPCPSVCLSVRSSLPRYGFIAHNIKRVSFILGTAVDLSWVCFLFIIKSLCLVCGILWRFKILCIHNDRCLEPTSLPPYSSQCFTDRVHIWSINLFLATVCLFCRILWYLKIMTIRWLVFESWFITALQPTKHDDVIKWKHFPRNWPFVRGILRTKASDAELWCFLWSASE